MKPRTSSTTRPFAVLGASIGASLLVLASTGARAGDVDGFFELSRQRSVGEFETPGAPRVDTETETWVRRVNVTWSRRLFPNVLAQIGANYERTDSDVTQDGFGRESRNATLRPFARLTMRSREYLAEASWNRSVETLRSGDLQTFRITRDTYLGALGWFRADLPSLRLEASRIEERDASRQAEDLTRDGVRLISEYSPFPSTRLYYRGSVERLDNRAEGSDFKTTAHTADVRFADVFFDGSWELSGGWTGSFRKTEIDSSGSGELILPVVAVAGALDLDDTPDEGALFPVPALAVPGLVDENTLVGTAVNLGLPPPAGDDRPRNMGVDFSISRDVNLLRVWVDRELPAEISATFTWEIWTSDDGRFWSRQATVPSAPFGPFDNRFELRFPDVQKRFVKLVVRPLGPTVPSASTYPTILVTEIEAFLAKPADTFSNSVSSTRNLLQASSRLRLLRRPGLYYETTFFHAATAGRRATWTLSNGLALQHRFNDVWSVSARTAREDGYDRGGDRVAYVYSASLSATPMETLRGNLVVSGSRDETGGFKQSNQGVLLNAIASVYRGIDLNAGVGRSQSDATNTPSSETRQLYFGATLAPHPTLTFSVRYDERDSDFSTNSVFEREDRTRSSEGSVAYNPQPSIYLYASRRYETRSGEPERTLDAFAFSWSPFPGGSLRFIVSYNENRNTLLDQLNRTFTPSLRWNISGRTYVDVSYQKLTTDTDVGSSRQNTLFGTLRVGF